MTVSSTITKNGPYIGNDQTVEFARTFLAVDEDHIKVYSTVTATGVKTEVTLGITKDGIGTASGNVTFDTAPITGTTIDIERVVPQLQETDYSNQGTVPPETIEDDLDLQMMALQDVQAQLTQIAEDGLDASGVTLDSLNAQPRSTTLDTLAATATTAGTDLAAGADAAAQRTLLDAYSTGQVYTQAEVDLLSMGDNAFAADFAMSDNVAYQNATGGPIMVMIKVNCSASSGVFDVKTGASGTTKIMDFTVSDFDTQVITIAVPNNHYYRITKTSGSVFAIRGAVYS